MFRNHFSNALAHLERLPSAALLVFSGESLLYISPGLAEQLGYKGAAAPKEKVQTLIGQADWGKLHEALLGSGCVPHMRLMLRGRNGERVGVDVYAAYSEDSRANSLVLWGVVDRGGADAEGTAGGAASPCAEHLTFGEGYGAAFSHEVRNPLSALVGLVGLLQGTTLNAEQRQLVDTIGGVADQMMSLVNDMIDSSRFQMGKIVIKRSPFALRPMLESLYNRFLMLSPQVQFKFDYDASLPPMVLGDSNRLAQVIVNLLSNAVKFTPSGEIAFRVQNMHNSRDVLFEVKDTGVGISEETMSRLFTPFERGQEAERALESGLGLYISKQLVEMHGGTIRVVSHAGEGCTVQVLLPLISVDLIGSEPQADVRQESGESIPAGDARRPARAGGQRILVVDDNRINVLVVSKFFDKWGLPNDAAYSGEEALRMIDKESYALVFMDLRMPGMDGFETCVHIRSRADAKAGIPIIALTASTESGVKERIAKAGMDGYLFKPFKMERLREIVDQYVANPSLPNPSGDGSGGN